MKLKIKKFVQSNFKFWFELKTLEIDPYCIKPC